MTWHVGFQQELGRLQRKQDQFVKQNRYARKQDNPRRLGRLATDYFFRAGTAIGDMRNNMRIPNLLQKKQEEDQE